MNSKVVHRGSPESVGSVAQRLSDAGIEAWVVDQPNFIVRMISFGTYRSRVVVPADQAQKARETLASWDAESRARIQDLGAQLRRQAMLALLPSLALTLGVYQAHQGEGRGLTLAAVLPAAWLLSMLFLSFVARLRGPR